MKIRYASISGVKRIQEFNESKPIHKKKNYHVKQSLSHLKTNKNSVYTKPKTNKETQDWKRSCAKDAWIYSGNTKFGSRIQELTKYKK